MTQVLPAIIPVNKEQLFEEMSKVSHFAELVQVDISDGVFTNTRTWPYNGQDRDYFEKLK
jgi:pentose-5-phosphate-3-epimerase